MSEQPIGPPRLDGKTTYNPRAGRYETTTRVRCVEHVRDDRGGLLVIVATLTEPDDEFWFDEREFATTDFLPPVGCIFDMSYTHAPHKTLVFAISNVELQ